MDQRYGSSDGDPFCILNEIEVTEIARRNSSDTANTTSSSPSSGMSNQVAAGKSTSPEARMKAFLRKIQAGHLILSQVTEVTQPSSSDKTNATSSSPSSGVSCQIAAETGTSAAASVQAALPEIQAKNLSLSQFTETTRDNSSGTENGASSSPSPGVSSQVAFSTSTSAAASLQASLREIQAAHLSLSQVQQPVSHAEQQLQQMQKQQLQQQQKQYEQNRHHPFSTTSNQHSHWNTVTQHNNSISHHHNRIPITPNPGSYHHLIKTAQPQILKPSPEKTTDFVELKQFAENFKQRRKKRGFSQGGVALAMGKLYGNEFSQTKISRFEELKLSHKSMCKLKSLPQKWLEDAESSLTNPGSLKNPMTTPEDSGRRRKMRTCVGVALENAFLQNPQPTSEKIAMLAKILAMEQEAVRFWFTNRRAKENMINSPSAATGSSTVTGSAPSNMLPSIETALAFPSIVSLLTAPRGHSFGSGLKTE